MTDVSRLNLVERLESISFARVVLPRSRRAQGELFEAEAQKFDEGRQEYVKCPSVFLTFGYNEDHVLNQVFVTQGKSGGDENAHAQILGILTSIGLQHGIPPQAFIRTLEGIQASVRPFEEEGEKRRIYRSIEDFMARKMGEYVIERGESPEISQVNNPIYTKEVLKVPDEVISKGKKLRFGKTGSSPLYLHLDQNDEGLLVAVFLGRGKSGGDESAHAESLGKLISLSLQYGLHPFRVVRSLAGMSSPSIIYADGHIYQSIEDAMGRSILDWYGQRGVDLEKLYHRVMNTEEDPTSSLEIPNFSLEGLGGNGSKEPCPNPKCGSRDYEVIEKPGTRGCRIYTCCSYEDGACR